MRLDYTVILALIVGIMFFTRMPVKIPFGLPMTNFPRNCTSLCLGKFVLR